MWLADWLYNVRFTYDWFYIIPLSFAIMMLSFATTGYIIVLVITLRRGDKNTDKIAKALDRVTEAINQFRVDSGENSNMIKDQLRKNETVLQSNRNSLDNLLNMFKKYDWTNWWVRK